MLARDQVGMLRGALSKAILPYGEETSALEQFHAANRPELAVLEKRGVARAEVERMQACLSLCVSVGRSGLVIEKNTVRFSQSK